MEQLSSPLNSAPGVQSGLQGTLGTFVRHMSENYGVDIHFRNEITGSCRGEVVDCIYRISTELLSNSVERSPDARISLEIWKGANGMIHLDYRDEAAGFDSRILEDWKGSLGSVRIHNTIQALGGFMLVRTSPGNGCSIDLKVKQTGLPAA